MRVYRTLIEAQGLFGRSETVVTSESYLPNVDSLLAPLRTLLLT